MPFGHAGDLGKSVFRLAEVVGKLVWLDVSPTRKPNLATLLWALGFHWNQRREVWQHPCGRFDPLGSHPADPRIKYRSQLSRRRAARLSQRISGQKWLTEWLTNQVETGHFNSDAIRLNHLIKQA